MCLMLLVCNQILKRRRCFRPFSLHVLQDGNMLDHQLLLFAPNNARAAAEPAAARSAQDGNVLYHQLLRAELLGVPVAPTSPDRGGGGPGGENGARGMASPMSSPAKKMFRYKSSDR